MIQKFKIQNVLIEIVSKIEFLGFVIYLVFDSCNLLIIKSLKS
jgi:hypothetical protein